MIVTIDTDKRAIIKELKVAEAKANFTMALEPKNQLMFIGCRNPSKLLVIDYTGRTISTLDIDGDTDDIFYDKLSNRIFVSCGAGYVDIVSQTGRGKYERTSRIETLPGARTSLFIPELNQLVVAAPARSGQKAQLLIFNLQ
jgi:hypothetical protein